MATTLYSRDETPTVFEIDHKETISDLVTQLGTDYAEYIKVDYSNQKQTLDETIDDILTRLDEFCGMIDMVRSDDALCLSKTLPGIYAKSQELEYLYQRIDKLEAFINIVRNNMEAMENKVTEAECLLGGSSVKKLFSSLHKPLFSKKSNGPKKRVKYEPPEIFQTSDYFGATTSIKATAELVTDTKEGEALQPIHRENKDEKPMQNDAEVDEQTTT